MNTESLINTEHSRILLAEDNVINQEVTIDMLELMGHNVDLACNGEEAVQLSQKNHYDIVLMDCQMPILNGFEATTKIRSLEVDKPHKHCIIALTGNALLGDDDKYLEAGMDDFLCKPFSYEKLKTILEKHHNANKTL